MEVEWDRLALVDVVWPGRCRGVAPAVEVKVDEQHVRRPADLFENPTLRRGRAERDVATVVAEALARHRGEVVRRAAAVVRGDGQAAVRPAGSDPEIRRHEVEAGRIRFAATDIERRQ